MFLCVSECFLLFQSVVEWCGLIWSVAVFVSVAVCCGMFLSVSMFY